MIRWNLLPHMKRAGIENPHQLAAAAGLTYQIVWRCTQSKPVDRVNIETLEKLAAALGVKNALDLLTHSK